jgi:NADPH:quinone reductase-like Zn-dependent oxidoreductase
MKAIQFHRFGKPEVLTYEEVERPHPQADEVCIRVKAASVNPKDCLIRKGKFTLVFGKKMPQRLGSDLAGEVVEVGEKVQSLQAGDRVFGMLPSRQQGAYAEYACMKAEHVAKLPDALSFAEGAALALVGLTSLQALRDLGRLQPGQQVLINGASGGVGTHAIQLARAMGAEVTTLSSDRNLDLCRQLGAHTALDYRKDPLTSWEQPLDLFYDVFGNRSFSQIKPLLAPRGTYISTVIKGRNFRDQLLTSFSARKAKVVIVKASGEDLAYLAQLAQNGQLKAVIDKRFPIEEVAAAHAYVETKRARGKVVLTWDPQGMEE